MRQIFTSSLIKQVHLNRRLLDPVVVSGSDSWNPVQSRGHNRTLFIGQLAYTADLWAFNVTIDSGALAQASKYMTNSMKDWLGMAP